jgi:hypothetical protein
VRNLNPINGRMFVWIGKNMEGNYPEILSYFTQNLCGATPSVKPISESRFRLSLRM